MKKRRLFCEINDFTYYLSTKRCLYTRKIRNIINKKIAAEKSEVIYPVLIRKHKSLMRRKLGNLDLSLQDNKAINLGIAAPKVSGIVIRPGETFSFWELVGKCSEQQGYKEGVTISLDKATKGIGGGMCQFTNLIHWLVLHTQLDIVEHHHHDNIDLFPDFGRQIPFGTGTSIVYNYVDYRFKNNTENTYQLITYVSDEYLHGELRAEKAEPCKFHIKCENEFFSREGDHVYRNSEIYRECVNKRTGLVDKRELIKINHAKVMYETSNLIIKDIV